MHFARARADAWLSDEGGKLQPRRHPAAPKPPKTKSQNMLLKAHNFVTEASITATITAEHTADGTYTTTAAAAYERAAITVARKTIGAAVRKELFAKHTLTKVQGRKPLRGSRAVEG